MSQKIVSVEGTLEQEANFDLREILPEECALAAAIGVPFASRYVYDCLVLQEHRGEHSVGIISMEEDGSLHSRRRVGSVREQFVGVNLDERLPGNVAIGHNRYATQGDPRNVTNIQPLFFQHTRFGPLAIAHNGTFLDSGRIRQDLVEEGVVFQSAMDTEMFGHLLARSEQETLEDAIIETARQIPTAYSLLILTKDKIVALRDAYGVRPLSMARLGEGYLLCSENYTFDQYPEAELLMELDPGSMVVFERGSNEYTTHSFAEADEHFCVFEGIYFSDPRSRYKGTYHEDFRIELGRQIYRENSHLEGDCIIPVLDSGKHAALGLAEMSGIPYKEFFKRLHNPPRAQRRSFTSATFEERVRTAYQKLHLRKEMIRGKRVVIVDDSIVRSTTIKIINQRLREAGAVSIVNCISAPPIVNICPFGMDFQERTQLVAHNNTIEEIREKVGADELLYLSLEGLNSVVDQTYQCGTCSGCFGGRYPCKGDTLESHISDNLLDS